MGQIIGIGIIVVIVASLVLATPAYLRTRRRERRWRDLERVHQASVDNTRKNLTFLAPDDHSSMRVVPPRPSFYDHAQEGQIK